MLPISKTNLIVGVKFYDSFNWYLAPKILWAINLDKMPKSDKVKYFEIINKVRKDLNILNEHNFEQFIKSIECFKLNTKTLKEDMKNILDKDLNFIEDFVPSIYLDLNNKKFYVINTLKNYYKNSLLDFELQEFQDLDIIDKKFHYWN